MVDVATGKEKRVPLTGPALDDFNARQAAAPTQQAQAARLAANYTALQQKARAALAQNTAFLALTPVQQQAQAVPHLVSLTRQSSAMIRLVLNLLDDVAGT